MHINTDNYYDKMADDYYNSEAFAPNEDDSYLLRCEQCSEEFEGDDIPHNEKCPECEVKLIEIDD